MSVPLWKTTLLPSVCTAHNYIGTHWQITMISRVVCVTSKHSGHATKTVVTEHQRYGHFALICRVIENQREEEKKEFQTFNLICMFWVVLLVFSNFFSVFFFLSGESFSSFAQTKPTISMMFFHLHLLKYWVMASSLLTIVFRRLSKQM